MLNELTTYEAMISKRVDMKNPESVIKRFDKWENMNYHGECARMVADFSGNQWAKAYAKASFDIIEALGHCPQDALALRLQAYKYARPAIALNWGEDVATQLCGSIR